MAYLIRKTVSDEEYKVSVGSNVVIGQRYDMGAERSFGIGRRYHHSDL